MANSAMDHPETLLQRNVQADMRSARIGKERVNGEAALTEIVDGQGLAGNAVAFQDRSLDIDLAAGLAACIHGHGTKLRLRSLGLCDPYHAGKAGEWATTLIAVRSVRHVERTALGAGGIR